MPIPQEKPIKNSIGVYAHIPYCASKCLYCDFNSAVARTAPERRYTDCLIKELASAAKAEDAKAGALQTIYIGGGTPSIFSPPPISRLIKAIKELLSPNADENVEITIEINPESIDDEKLDGYGNAGVNRVSIGVQSFNDAMLKTLGRIHTAQKAIDAFILARKAGFDNIGVDLIFALPGQSLNDWKAELQKVVELGAEHISLYGLTIEQNTPFYAKYKILSTDGLPSEEEEAQMYEVAVETLKKAGYVHYEISNFAMPGRLSRHNQRYWYGLDTIGLGAGAHSFVNTPPWGKRHWNEKNPERYMNLVEAGGKASAGGETLTKAQAMTECAMLSLRMIERGIDIAAFCERFGVAPDAAFKNLGMLKDSGLVSITDNAIRLTPRGVLISNEVFLSLTKTLL